MNSLESGSNVQSGLEMIMEKSPDTIVLVDRNLTLVKVISAKDVNPAKRNVMVVKNEMRLLKQKRNVLQI